MIDVAGEREAALQRLGIEPEELLPPLCPCGKPVAPKRRKYCSEVCLRRSMDYASRKGRTSYQEEKQKRNERIFQLRDQGLTGPAIAEIVGVHKCTVYRALNGDRREYDRKRVSLSVERTDLKLWKRLAASGDQSVRCFIIDVVTSEAERRTSLLEYLKTGRQS